MKKSNLKMIALGLIASLAIASCDVQHPRNKGPRHKDRGHHGDNRGGNHSDRRY